MVRPSSISVIASVSQICFFAPKQNTLPPPPKKKIVTVYMPGLTRLSIMN